MPENDLPSVGDALRAHDLLARKALGQNFLLDLNLTRKIARAAGPLEGSHIVEIGPGPGGLTRALLEEGTAKVTAIERDTRFMPILDDIARHFAGRLEIVEADALDLDYTGLVGDGPARIVANLPYNIATPLLVGWLSETPWPAWFDRAVLMFQREVADRLVAGPGGKTFGRLSVLTQWRTRARILFDVPPQAFTPPPKVTSTVVELIPTPLPPDAPPPDMVERVTAAAFGQRRKMLRQSLKPFLKELEPVLAARGIAETARAETLTVDDFIALAAALAPDRRQS